jgi:DNA (cytosine-5)-methyltransferase 1
MTRVGSLCSGYGGLDLAVCAHYDGHVAWHSEVNPDACKVLEPRWPGVPNVGDLTTADWSQVEPVDVLTAGYPCQPFSQAGRRKGTSDDRHLWPHIAHAIGVLRPRLVVLENVRGHLSLGAATVLADLTGLGYVGSWGVVRASDTGAPHRRERVFIAARRGDAADAGGGGIPADRGMGGRSPGGGDRPAGALVPAGPAMVLTTHPVQSRGHAAPDTGSGGRDGRAGRRGARRSTPERREAGVSWGPYAAAIDRWAAVLGRPAPAPLVGRQLNARLVEWMMGLPEGWVTDPLPNRKALRVLGNGVVPQQAALALALLAPHAQGVAA